MKLFLFFQFVLFYFLFYFYFHFQAQKKVLRALAVDKESYQTWDALYPRYVLQSTQVILFLTDKWDKYAPPHTPPHTHTHTHHRTRTRTHG